MCIIPSVVLLVGVVMVTGSVVMVTGSVVVVMVILQPVGGGSGEGFASMGRLHMLL